MLNNAALSACVIDNAALAQQIGSSTRCTIHVLFDRGGFWIHHPFSARVLNSAGVKSGYDTQPGHLLLSLGWLAWTVLNTSSRIGMRQNIGCGVQITFEVTTYQRASLVEKSTSHSTTPRPDTIAAKVRFLGVLETASQLRDVNRKIYDEKVLPATQQFVFQRALIHIVH